MSAADDWTQAADWWTSPALAYLAGLRHGAQLERERRAAEDDLAWRQAVQNARRVIDFGDARAQADRPGPRAGDWTGVAA